MSATFTFENVLAVKETGLALLCEYAGEQFWIPKSCIDDESDVTDEGDEGALVVSEWWATKEGWA